MNIIKRELKANLKTFIIWILVLTLLLFAASTEFGAFQDNPAFLDSFEGMEGMEAMFDAIGGSFANMSTPEGFLSLMSIYLYLPLSIYGALLGSSIISKEERDRTAEYLFTLPIKRNQVLLRKIIVAITYQILFVVYILLASILVFSRYGIDSNFYNFMLYMFVALSFTSLIFLTMGMMFSSVLRQYKKSGAITLGILITTYMLSMLIRLVEELEFLNYVVPFQYFEVTDMLNGDIKWIFVVISIIIISSCISAVFYFYKRRDLYI